MAFGDDLLVREGRGRGDAVVASLCTALLSIIGAEASGVRRRFAPDAADEAADDVAALRSGEVALAIGSYGTSPPTSEGSTSPPSRSAG
jgi:hypothetical protein